MYEKVIRRSARPAVAAPNAARRNIPRVPVPGRSAGHRLQNITMEHDVPVQRKVGYEFETGWLIAHEDDVVEKDPLGVGDVPAKRLRPLTKKDPVGTLTFNTFKVEADEADAGQSEIEFIVHPPIDETPANLEELAAIMDLIGLVGAGLLAHKAAPFHLNLVTGAPADAAYVVTPVDATLSAGPQITSGIDLAKIPTIASHKGAGQHAPAGLQRSLDALEAGAGTIARNVGKTSPQLLGLLTLIRSYLRAGQSNLSEEHRAIPEVRYGTALSYPKQIADGALLARTNFSKLFRLLPPSEQLRYYKDKGAWLDLVRAAVGLTVEDLFKPVIERGIQGDIKKQKVEQVGPTRIDWLVGITEGIDPLALTPGGESLGELGEKTEGVSGGGRVEAGIFEFRGAQTTKIPLGAWKPFALDAFRFLLTLHDQSLPIPIPQKKQAAK
jgi:hypothetical protein